MNKYNKSEKVGIGIYFILLVVLILWLIYFLYFSNDFMLIVDSFKNNFSEFYCLFYFLIFCIGLWILMIVGQRIVEKLFYPDDKVDKKRKEIYKDYRNNRNRLNQRRLRIERDIKIKKLSLKELEDKLKKIENE